MNDNGITVKLVRRDGHLVKSEARVILILLNRKHTFFWWGLGVALIA